MDRTLRMPDEDDRPAVVVVGEIVLPARRAGCRRRWPPPARSAVPPFNAGHRHLAVHGGPHGAELGEAGGLERSRPPFRPVARGRRCRSARSNGRVDVEAVERRAAPAGARAALVVTRPGHRGGTGSTVHGSAAWPGCTATPCSRRLGGCVAAAPAAGMTDGEHAGESAPTRPAGPSAACFRVYHVHCASPPRPHVGRLPHGRASLEARDKAAVEHQASDQPARPSA